MHLTPGAARAVLPLLLCGLLSGCAGVALGSSDTSRAEAHPPARPHAGPLETGAPNRTSCLEVRRRTTELTYGFENIRNTGYAPTEITGIDLVRPHGLEVTGAVVVPLQDSAVLGNYATWPPPAHRLGGGIGWSNRAPALRYALPTTPDTDQGYNLVLHLRRTGRPSAFAGIEVTYQVGDLVYHRRSHTTFTAARTCP